jgi:hypothetical protein
MGRNGEVPLGTVRIIEDLDMPVAEVEKLGYRILEH